MNYDLILIKFTRTIFFFFFIFYFRSKSLEYEQLSAFDTFQSILLIKTWFMISGRHSILTIRWKFNVNQVGSYPKDQEIVTKNWKHENSHIYSCWEPLVLEDLNYQLSSTDQTNLHLVENISFLSTRFSGAACGKGLHRKTSFIPIFYSTHFS
jgi:hypothetical protein